MRAAGRPERRSSTSSRSLLDSPVRRSVVDLLAGLPAALDGAPPGLTAKELGDRLELHVTTVRFHLDLLVSAGILESELRGGQVGRPRKVYRVRPGGLLGESPVEAFTALTEILAESWPAPGEVAISPEEAGRRWMLRHAEAPESAEGPSGSAGAWLGRIGRVIDLLENWGYRPDLRTAEGGEVIEMTLVDCPFIPLAATRADVVCGVHQGLIRGALESAGEVDPEVRLLPLVSPRTCVAHLRRAPLPPASPSEERLDEELP